MKSNVETIADDNGIELLVGYRYENSPSYYEEPENPGSLVQEMVYTELESVEVVIKGQGIQILPMLTEKQKEYIISNLSYE